MFDSHAHLTDKAFDKDRDEVISRALEAGVMEMLTIPSVIEGFEKHFELLNKYGFIYGSVGIHPGEITEALNFKVEKELLKLVTETISKSKKIVALGEIGLDYHYQDSAPKELQKRFFNLQLAVAKEHNLPVLIHCRDAWQDMMEVLDREKHICGVMHCFSGSVDIMRKCLDSGLFISIAGPVTFNNAQKLIEACKEVPLDKLLVETDCPYLAPQQMRGKRNEPSFVRYTLSKIAEIKNLPAATLSELTHQNTKKLFRI